MKRYLSCLGLFIVLLLAVGPLLTPAAQTDDPSPPAEPVKLIFVHHSTGGNWLADPNDDQPYGGLGRALMENNYYVSATNYGWGPDSIGDRTDIVNWPEWFTGPNSATYLEALYTESGQNVGDFGAWPRLSDDPGGENQIIVFKSCFPNSDLYGSPDDPPLDEPSEWEEYSVSNAKAIYNELLTYFATRQDKLFVVITAPPLRQAETAPERAANARAFNNWLVNEWLRDYPHSNVAVFDYYNVLTAPENHHRWTGGGIEHVQVVDNDFAAYPSGDSHPSTAGHQKATEEFVPLLNVYYHRWQADGAAPPPPPPAEQPTEPPAPTERPTDPSPPAEPSAPPEAPTESPPSEPGVVDDFESGAVGWWSDMGEGSAVACEPGGESVHAGSGALRIEYDVPLGSWGGCGRYFDALQDWSGGGGISFWLRSDRPEQWVTFAVFGGELDGPTPYEVHVKAPETWTRFVFAWEDLPRAEWVGEQGSPQLDPARVVSLGFSLGADGGGRQGEMWVDDITLVEAVAPTPAGPTTEPPTEPVEAPTEPPAEEPAEEQPTEELVVEPVKEPTEEPAGEKSGGGGICPGSAMILPLSLLGVFLLRRQTRLA